MEGDKMPILSPIPKRPRGSKKLPPIPAMIVEDCCVFNLQALMLGLGLTEESTKKWCWRHGVRAVSQGRTWLFLGETFRRDLKQYEAKHGGIE
jgi:hypothetical protein